MRLWLLNLVPYRLRTRGPFRRYFWQAEEIERTYRSAARLADDFGWNDSDDERTKMSAPTDIIDIGPECFAAADGSVICWRGQNYTPQRIGLRVRLHNLVVGFRNRRIDAQSRRKGPS